MTIDFFAFINTLLQDDNYEAWQDTLLEKVEVFQRQKTWHLHIRTLRPIPCKEIKRAAERIRSSFNFIEHIDIIPSPATCREQIDIILNRHRQEMALFLFPDPVDLTSLNILTNDNGIDLVVGENSLYTYILDHESCNSLSAWFWREYRLRLVVKAIHDGYLRPEASGKSFLAQREVQFLPVDNNPVRKKSGGKNDKNTLDLLKTSPVIKLSEIEEGLKAAVVEGEIWDKKFTVIRGGRVVVSYYLTDFEDTVIIKTFYEHIEEDRINIGDWIRVCGSSRYDERTREVVIFMDAYSPHDRVVRMDTAPQKRIELHAHTKMSAMDGLTDIKDMIKRAAEWNHPAVAITDHGCTQAFPEAYQAAKKHKIKIIYGVEAYLVEKDKKDKPYHIIILTQNLTGLKNLYKLVSISYLDYYYRKPKIPRDVLNNHREGLLLGSACEAGELYSAILRGIENTEIEKIASFYDYLEIQPLDNNEFLLRDGRVKSRHGLQEINRRIVDLGKRLQIPVAATGDVHFLEPHHGIFRRIIQAGQGYEDAEGQAPLYFRSTDEMLAEFAYLGEDDAHRVVIVNTGLIADMIEEIKPVPDGFYPPKIDSAEEEILRLSWGRAHMLYGRELPPVVEERVSRELNSITKHGFSVLYMIAHKLVKKSNEDGYMVGSRGSVGSSLVAYLTGITEVNPLPPHYRCPVCSYCEFITDGSYGCGVDLEDKSCRGCGRELLKDGFDIPFETFLGFEGDKIPDIDLNFSGDYQSRAHQYVEELFGKENVYRAGTISTIADKTAYGFVKKYAEEKRVEIKYSEINRLVKGITGVRRTTGQHPGGLIVVPQEHDILEFTPLQHPADNKESGIITTHFEYHAIGDQLVKLDILGHDGPTVIKELEDLTGVEAAGINLGDENIMAIFSGLEPLNINNKDIFTKAGTYGIPEFGTRFVRQMLEATRPTTFAELVRICGLSHGTDVWLNNAQTLIEGEVASLSEVICTRDDIMIYLIQKGMDKQLAFKIMESVRKGKGLKTEEVTAMQLCSVPSWYIDSCQKIKYMFPKAHAVAYVTMSFRIAYFKVNYPLEFYSSFFSIRAEDFEIETILEGYDTMCRRIKEIDKAGLDAAPKDRKLVPILELAMEMYARGYKFYPVDIYRSQADRFLVYPDGLLLPFSALPNVGLNAAQGIANARSDDSFLSIEDFQQKTRLNKTGMDILRKYDCFQGLPESTQMQLFG